MKRITVVMVALVLASGASVGASPAPGVSIPIPSWARPSTAVGPIDRDEVVQIQLVLPWRDPAAAARFAAEVSRPDSESYGRFLSPQAFRARFSPADSTVAAVTRWARSVGLEVGGMPANRIVIPVRGTADRVGRAFSTTFSWYRVFGLSLRAPDREPTLPDALASRGVTVRGLDQSAALLRVNGERPATQIDVANDPPPELGEPPSAADTTPPAAVVYPPTCSAYDGQMLATGVPRFEGRVPSIVTCQTTPQALRDAYGVTGLLSRGIDGTGQTIVMTGSHSIRHLASDVDTWSGKHGVARLKPGQLRQSSYPGAYQTPVVEPVFRGTVWAQQASMIMETMHTIAPGADLLFLGSTSSLDLPNATLLAVDQRYGDVVINGWYSLVEDETPADDALITRIAEQAAATGISVLFASGDLGDTTKFQDPIPEVDLEIEKDMIFPSVAWPANNPLVTSVGATSLILGPDGRYLTELGWAKSMQRLTDGKWAEEETARFRGSGGGLSKVFPQPDFQQTVVPPTLAARADGSLGRAVPDVAVAGDAETGMLIGYTQRFPDGADRYSERRIAADTVSTGLFGAIAALANDARGQNLGFLNPALYALSGTSPDAFRDILLSGTPKSGVRIDYANNLNDSAGTITWVKPFEAFGANKTGPGYDTATGIGSPSLTFFQRLVPSLAPVKQPPKVKGVKHAKDLPATGIESPLLLGLTLLVASLALGRRWARAIDP